MPLPQDSILKEYQTDKTITIANLKNIDNSEDASEQEASRPPAHPRARATETRLHASRNARDL